MPSTGDALTNVGCYCPVDSWNPVAVGPDLIEGEAFTLMFDSFMVMSNDHFCNVMIFGNDCRVLDGVGKRGVAQPSSYPEDTIFITEGIKRV